MRYNPKISIIIPTLNKKKSINLILNNIPKNLIKKIIIINNNNHDNTTTIAENFKIKIISKPLKNYNSTYHKNILNHNLLITLILLLPQNFLLQ